MPREYRCISADSHLDIVPSRWAGHIPAQYREHAPKDPQAYITADGHLVKPFEGLGSRVYPEVEIGPGFTDRPGTGSPQQRVRELDIDGVDAEVLFSGVQGPPVWRSTIKDDPAYLAVVRAYNEHLWQEYCAVAPDRLLGLGIIPVTGVEDAIAEMEYCVKNGLPGVQLNSFPTGLSHPSAADDRFWAASIDLDCPITVHVEFNYPVAGAEPNGVSPRTYGAGTAGSAFTYPKYPEKGFLDIILRYAKYGFRGALHAVQLTWAGVFDRFPTFRIYFAETQIGWIPNFLEQMDQHYLRHQEFAEKLLGLQALRQLPSEYVKEHCYWGFQYNPVGLREMHREVGVDRIMWASDFPHGDSTWPESQRIIDEHMRGVPLAEQKMILHDNVQRLYRF